MKFRKSLYIMSRIFKLRIEHQTYLVLLIFNSWKYRRKLLLENLEQKYIQYIG